MGSQYSRMLSLSCAALGVSKAFLLCLLTRCFSAVAELLVMSVQQSQQDENNIVRHSLAFGFSVTAIVWMIADISGGHINPAVTVAFVVTRKISVLRYASPNTGGYIASLVSLRNSLPNDLRQQDICLTEFNRLLKTFLFGETRRIVTSLF